MLMFFPDLIREMTEVALAGIDDNLCQFSNQKLSILYIYYIHIYTHTYIQVYTDMYIYICTFYI